MSFLRVLRAPCAIGIRVSKKIKYKRLSLPSIWLVLNLQPYLAHFNILISLILRPKFCFRSNLPILTMEMGFESGVRFCTFFCTKTSHFFTFFVIFSAFCSFFRLFLTFFVIFSRHQLTAVAAKNRTDCASTHRKNREKIKNFLLL